MCLLLILPWGVSGTNKGDTGKWKLEEKHLKENIDSYAICKSFAVKEYLTCLSRWGKRDKSQKQIQYCRQNYDV